jgi:hypothetical protein
MTGKSRVAEAAKLMNAFVARKHRYLWTDAYAVCNGLALARLTGEARWQALALEIVNDVHHVLGQYRPDDSRFGWLSGLSGAEAEAHPTAGGLRIGKPLPERLVTDPHDPDLEWDRDGQYFHYSTKWMHALDQVARAMRESSFHVWARELAVVAHGAFTDGPAWGRRMFWKISIDRSRPLVRSMGQHDPLDGFVTCVELEATADMLGLPHEPSVAAASADFARMSEQMPLHTTDPLGLGGLFFDAARLRLAGGHEALVSALFDAGLQGLRHFVDEQELRLPAAQRLAFRELGLAIGLASLPPDAPRELEELRLLADEITTFWRDPAHRRARSWLDHEDINDVMLATSLLA